MTLDLLSSGRRNHLNWPGSSSYHRGSVVTTNREFESNLHVRPPMSTALTSMSYCNDFGGVSTYGASSPNREEYASRLDGRRWSNTSSVFQQSILGSNAAAALRTPAPSARPQCTTNIPREEIKEIPKVHIQEVITYVPKVVIKEKIVEVPEIEYKEVTVERIVPVVETREEVRIKEIPVPRHVEVPVPEYYNVEVEKDVHRKVPVPLECVTCDRYELPKIVPRIVNVPVPVFFPRFREVAVPVEQLDVDTVRTAEQLLESIANVCCAPVPSLTRVEEVASAATEFTFICETDPTAIQRTLMMGGNKRTAGRQPRSEDRVLNAVCGWPTNTPTDGGAQKVSDLETFLTNTQGAQSKIGMQLKNGHEDSVFPFDKTETASDDTSLQLSPASRIMSNGRYRQQSVNSVCHLPPFKATDPNTREGKDDGTDFRTARGDSPAIKLPPVQTLSNGNRKVSEDGSEDKTVATTSGAGTSDDTASVELPLWLPDEFVTGLATSMGVAVNASDNRKSLEASVGELLSSRGKLRDAEVDKLRRAAADRAGMHHDSGDVNELAVKP
eukprot:Lankesteria_metandrocarpae@DN4500_c0_g1_i1.p1